MHTSWFYSITGISGYAIDDIKAVRNGFERHVENAVRLIRRSLPCSPELLFIYALPVILALAVLSVIIGKTNCVAEAVAPDPARPKSRSKTLYLVIRISPKPSEDAKRRCKHCREHDLAFRKGEWRRIRSLDFGRVKVYVEVEVRRLRCKTCGKAFYEKIPFLTNPKARATRALEWQMIELRADMSITDVARWLDVDWRSVKDAEKRILEARYRRINLKQTHIIGIDEICLFHRQKKGRQYLTVVRDMESGAVVNVSRGKGGDALKAFAWRLKTQGARIDCVCMDMSNAYGKWAKDKLKGATVVYDHFHVVKAMNDRINDIRRNAMSRISADVRKRIREIDVEALAKEAVLAAIKKEQEREEKAKESLKGNRRLLTMNAEDVKDKPRAKAKLDRMLAENSDLGKAYVLKEELRDIYAYAAEEGKARTLLLEWIGKARASDVAQLESMAKTLESHLDGVLGFWKYRHVSNAKTEGFNNKIRWLVKQAYGYRDFKYLKLKIFDLPNTKSREDDF